MAKAESTWKQTWDWIGLDTRRYAPQPDKLIQQGVRNLYSHPSYAGVVFYRIGHWDWGARTRSVARFVHFVYRLLYPLMRLYSGAELQPRAEIGPGLGILHFGTVVIHPDVVAGSDLTLLPGVTIGEGTGGTPRLGDRVAIGAGAIVIGGIRIGNDIRIGAGAVVTRDLPDGCVAVGVPARPIGLRVAYGD